MLHIESRPTDGNGNRWKDQTSRHTWRSSRPLTHTLPTGLSRCAAYTGDRSPIWPCADMKKGKRMLTSTVHRSRPSVLHNRERDRHRCRPAGEEFEMISSLLM